MLRKILTILAAAVVPIQAYAASHGCVAINLANYTQTFQDDFATLSVSCTSPKTPATWYCHKPDNQDFGQVGFNHFSVAGGILTIPLVLNGGTWEGGIIASIDASGAGFKQQFGYFEARMQVSAVAGGNWPAFWLLAACHIPFPGTCDDVEIDVVEQFGNFIPNRMNMTYHHWISPTPEVTALNRDIVGGMSGAYHTFGVDVQDDFISWYYDRCLVGQIPTPVAAKTPMYVLVDHACSGSPPCNDPATQSPTNLLVDDVRVYQKN